MRSRIRLTGVRNLLITLLVLVALLFAADRLLPFFSVMQTDEDYNDNVDFFRLEKTPVESFLTVGEAAALCAENGINVSGYQVNAYPIIDDMPSTEQTDGDTVNIVVIGDSFVWGDNSLNRNELFWRQTERLLRARGYNCKVTAIAMAGASAYEEIGWYENYLKENTPDLVVFGYVFNDPIRDGTAEAQIEAPEYADFIPVLRPVRSLLPNIYDSISSYIDSKTIYLDKFDEKRPNAVKGILKGEVRADYQQNFADRLDEITKTARIPSVVMALPVIPRSMTFKALFRPLPEIYANTSVTFYDPYDDFDAFYSAKHKKNLFVNPANNHPGSATHYFYACYLADALERDFSDVLGEKQNGSLCSRVINVNECTPCDIGLQAVTQSESLAEYTFSYPTEEQHTYLFSATSQYRLTYPLGKGYIKLSLENPADLSAVTLEGAPAGRTELYYTRIDPRLGYDDNTLYPVALTDDGGVLRGEIGDAGIASICLHVDADAAPQGEITLKLFS